MTNQDLNSKTLRRKFAAAAKSYDEAAVLQREVADRMLERLQYIKKIPDLILDAGCGTGYCANEIQKIYPESYVCGFDIAFPMLDLANGSNGRNENHLGFFAADTHLIPVRSKSVDLIVSNLVLQWCDSKAVFNEFSRILKPGGLLMFTTFGPDTLYELREAWSKVDTNQHVHDFIDMHNLGDELVSSGMADPVMDKETLKLTYKDVSDMVNDLRNIGANNAVSRQFSGLTGKDKFARFKKAYSDMAEEGRIPASYEVIYGQAWGTDKPGVYQVEHKKIIPVKTQYKTS